MTGLKFLIVITKRDFTDEYIAFFKRYNIPQVVENFADGTASKSILSLFALERTEKVVFQFMVKEEEAHAIFIGLKRELNIDESGNGIALLIPVENVGGMSSLNYFLGEKPYEKKENIMQTTDFNYSLLMIIAEKGNVDLVMDAARESGARGGTVVRGKGTGTKIDKFFGVQIVEEKDIIYVVTRAENKATIMKAIMEKAGVNSPAHSVIFSLPVEHVAGIKSLVPDQEL